MPARFSRDRAGSGYSRAGCVHGFADDGLDHGHLLDDGGPHRFRVWSRGSRCRIGGSVGRAEATAQGLVYVVEEACKMKKISLRGATVAIQGFGNAGARCGEIPGGEEGEDHRASDTARRSHEFPRHRPIKAIRYKERSARSLVCREHRGSPMTIC